MQPVAAEKTTPLIIDRARWGTLFGLSSALFYSIAHLLLRGVVHIDPVLVSWVKTLPSILFGGMMVVWLMASGKRLVSAHIDLLRIASAAAVAHFGGNIVFQWALGIVGLAIGVPVTLGSLLIGSALFGRLFLAEPVRKRSAITVVIVISAIAILSVGSNSAAASMSNQVRPTSLAMTMIAVLGFCLAGISYSVLGATVRWTGTRGMTAGTTMFVSGGVGALLLGGICGVRLPWDYFSAITRADWLTMSLAAVSNVAAFLSIIVALHLTRLLKVNLLNAAQSAFAAIAGVLFYSEPLNWSLIFGVSLMAIGFAYGSRGER